MTSPETSGASGIGSVEAQKLVSADQSPSRRFPWLNAIVVFAGLVLLVAFATARAHQWRTSPSVFLLEDQGRAKWIRSYHAFNLGQHHFAWLRETMFRCEFQLEQPVANAEIVVDAFRRCHVWIDADPNLSPPLKSSNPDYRLWRNSNVIRLSGGLAAGYHTLVIFVGNQAAHPCLRVSSPDLGIFSGITWETKEDGTDWMPAILASGTASSVPAQMRDAGYVPVIQSLHRIWPSVTIIFVVSLAIAWLSRRPSDVNCEGFRYLSAGRIRWGLLIAWIVIGANNLWRIPVGFGYDVREHVEYVQYIIENNRLPLAIDGWQMFQSPLMYLLAAPFYVLSISLFGPDLDACEKLLRCLPLLCGLAEIEIVYRAVRVVFPDDENRQIVGTLIGAMIPMNLYMSQVFGNEPLAGVMTALVVLMCLRSLMKPSDRHGLSFYCLLGGVWGLALLSKLTPLILAPLLFAVVCYQSVVVDRSLSLGLIRTIAAFGSATLISGWYFARNWIQLGRPFIGGWDPSRGIKWWQDPSFRTWSQLASFGRSLIQPMYAGVLSFWDALYTTMWADGFLSGTSISADKIPWNVDWMAVGVWLAILPTGCLAISLPLLFTSGLTRARSSLLFAAAAIGIYLAAILDLFMQVPVYGSGKASYALGLLPCFGVLAAAGAGPLLRVKYLRELTIALLTTWSVTSFLSYFCIR